MEEYLPVSLGVGGCAHPLISVGSTSPNPNHSGLYPPVSCSDDLRPQEEGSGSKRQRSGDWGQSLSNNIIPQVPTPIILCAEGTSNNNSFLDSVSETEQNFVSSQNVYFYHLGTGRLGCRNRELGLYSSRSAFYYYYYYYYRQTDC